MKSYLIYLLKTKWIQTLVMVLIPTAIFVATVTMSKNSYLREDMYGLLRYYAPNIFATPVVFIMILIPIVVIFRLSIFRNTKDVDLYYSLPMSRQKLLLTQLIFGLIQIVLIWTTMYMLGLITFSIITQGYFLTRYLLLLYIIVIGYIIIIYGITTFLFLKANTLIDGISFIIIFHTLCLFISLFFANRFFWAFGFNQPLAFNPFYSLGQLTGYFISLSLPVISIDMPSFDPQSQIAITMNSLFYLTLAVLGFILSYQSITLEKSEQIGRLSLSKMGYVSLIPLNLLFASAGLHVIFYRTSVLSISILATAGFIGFFIMRRSAKIKWVDVASVIIPIFIGIILKFIL